MANNLGIKDAPIINLDEDSLNLKDHAKILAEFIKECDTPMTIGIQGDWGSGKTSMMNMVKHLLEKDEEIKNDTIKCVWFNTWQYAQFNMENTLALSLISRLIEDIQEKLGNYSRKIAEKCKVLGDVLLKVAIGYASGGAMNNVKSKPEDPSKNLKELKKSLTNFISGLSGEKKSIKLVIFIDDIDRLKPLKAIELLETLKLFLDIEGCIFVLACDYKIVMQGLKEKFGTTGEEEGKSFFDKIIQVPYNIPMHQYKIENYIKELLKKVEIDIDKLPADIGNKVAEKYRKLLENSVGTNPRSYKRLFNSFLLFKKVIDFQKEKQKDDYPFREFEEKGIIKEYEKYLIMFAVLCLQVKYEKVFYFLTKKEISSEWFGKFKSSEIMEDESFFKEFNINKNEINNFCEFMRSFFDAVQLSKGKSDDLLEEEEINVLKKILSASNIVSNKIDIDIDDILGDKRKLENLLIEQIKEELNSIIRKPDEGENKKISWNISTNDYKINSMFILVEAKRTKLYVFVGFSGSNKRKLGKLYNKIGYLDPDDLFDNDYDMDEDDFDISENLMNIYKKCLGFKWNQEDRSVGFKNEIYIEELNDKMKLKEIIENTLNAILFMKEFLKENGINLDE